MKSFTRKTVSLLLVAAFVIALALSAFAAVPDEDEVTPTAACSHVYQLLSDKATGNYQYYSTTRHCAEYIKKEKCRLCGITVTAVYIRPKEYKGHTNMLESASCNGTKQTWNYHCNVCNHTTISTTKACPGAPHGVVCRWLPV